MWWLQRVDKPEDGFDSRASRRNTSASHLRVLTSDDKSVLFQVIDFVVICDDSSRQLHRGEKKTCRREGVNYQRRGHAWGGNGNDAVLTSDLSPENPAVPTLTLWMLGRCPACPWRVRPREAEKSHVSCTHSWCQPPAHKRNGLRPRSPHEPPDNYSFVSSPM